MTQCDDLRPSFFCVPDITGFTRLVATADIEFCKEVIPGLLRRLIDANMLNMHVGEVEGDAIFFYKLGRLPSAARIKEQCYRFYQRFYAHIRHFEKTHPGEYQKHLANGQIGLKIIIHYGCAITANIKGRTKLIGRDIIITHRLLKNSVNLNDYVLLTSDYLKRTEHETAGSFFGLENSREGSETYDYLGEISYSCAEACDVTATLAFTGARDKKTA
jgi:hypothetical protein